MEDNKIGFSNPSIDTKSVVQMPPKTMANAIQRTSSGSMVSSPQMIANKLKNANIVSTIGKNRIVPHVPISNEGMGVCIRCGNVGVKDTFYGKGKQYCSASCVRGLPPQPQQTPLFKIVTLPSNKPKLVSKTSSVSSTPIHTVSTGPQPLQPQTQTQKKRPFVKLQQLSSSSSSSFAKKTNKTQTKSAHNCSNGFDWTNILHDPSVRGVPISSFPHAPLCETWESLVTIGLKLEVKNRDFSTAKPNQEFHWIASVVRIAGYMVQLRYEGFGNDSSQDFWINIFTTQVHPVGWCASQGKALIPPKTIEDKNSDWKGFLVKRLTGSRTLPENFGDQVKDSLKTRFRFGMRLEVVDKNRISAVRVALIDEIVGGRLHVTYEGSEDVDEGFWCHQRSNLIHPVGWAQVVGHELRATPEYAKSSLQKSLSKQFEDSDCAWSLFQMPLSAISTELRFREGMKLEAIDPLNLSTICVATVTKVLRNNYLMIGIDGMMSPNGSDWFCYHATSPCIFPVGFCGLNDIQLTPPRGYKTEFNWFQYLKETKATAAPVPLFKKDIPKHGFKEGMFVEAVDLMEPRLICVATITKVVGRLLRVHFVGWDESYDQWCDCESPDLFPIGWCQLVNYPLESPKEDDLTGIQNMTPNESNKRRRNLCRNRNQKRKKRLSPSIAGNDFKFEEPEDINTSFASESWIHNQDDTISSSSSLSVSSNSAVIIKPSPIIKTSSDASDLGSDPRVWTIQEVVQFLRQNDCSSYCDSFLLNKIDGKKFLSLNREEILELTLMKVGPSLKIHALIQSLINKKY
ncbi:MBT domain-containing protein 1-like [Oppia nitens]|uniref:MBT domain-containing protein 1-like n=1 Tax=Oppia nitens TaxID=1686743 RepID=UPI0023DBC8C3|nr:MBT domain-containing protein 1-like [Oppia nitens]